jgi:trans-aconitate 2-methyltransferase
VKDWDAASYHLVSEPQLAWGLDVLARTELTGAEATVDVGCGTGRLTLELARRLPRGHVVAVDVSQSMIDQAAKHFAEARLNPRATGEPRPALVRADAAALPFDRRFDLVFSTATFHWVPDHDRLFASIFGALNPRGRLVAQCGGGPNLSRLYARITELARRPDFAPHFRDWRGPWNFADADSTRRRLESAGFVDVNTSVQSSSVTLPDRASYSTFVHTVCLRPHLSRLPAELHEPFVTAVADEAAHDDPPLTLDYWRLDMRGKRPA